MVEGDIRQSLLRSLRAAVERGERKLHVQEVLEAAGMGEQWGALSSGKTWKPGTAPPPRDERIEELEEELHGLQSQGLLYLRYQIPSTGFSGARRHYNVPDHPVFPNHLVISRLGALAFGHELLLAVEPEFGARLAGACPGIKSEIVARAEDASACLRHGLLRPAVVMIGVMFEEALAQLYEDCDVEAKQTLRKAENHRQRLEQFQALVDVAKGEFPAEFRQNTQGSYVALVNLVAERIRRERNSAAHYGPDGRHRQEVEALVNESVWALVELWKYREVIRQMDSGSTAR